MSPRPNGQVTGSTGKDGQAVVSIDERRILFGHTHRAATTIETGVAVGDSRLLNTGCYRAGFAAWVDAESVTPPELVNLLERSS